tara:strand:- start:432 stop:605 length:174 start_codon:yes stop_codon:yes gene_type:complete
MYIPELYPILDTEFAQWRDGMTAPWLYNLRHSNPYNHTNDDMFATMCATAFNQREAE